MQSKSLVKLVLFASIVVSIAGFMVFYCGNPSFQLSDPLAVAHGNAVGLIDFTSTEINAGDANIRSERQFLFSLQNISGEAVVIDTVAPDCTCFSATHERMIQPGSSSEITLTIKPSSHKTRYVVNVVAKQGHRVQAYKLAVVFDNVETNSVIFEPPTVMIGELIAERPFKVQRTVRIVGSNGDLIHPIAADVPKWINVDIARDEGAEILTFTGVAPKSNVSNRDAMELILPKPYGRESLEFAYSLRPQYLVEPHRVFGFSGKDHTNEGTVEVKGLGDSDTIQWSVTMESEGSVEISRESRQGQFRIVPVFTNDADEICGTVTWTIYAGSKEKVAECISEFCFVLAVQVDKRDVKD